MKPIWKHIIASICALATIAYMVFGLWMSRKTAVVPVCRQCQVHVLDEQQRQYVGYGELMQLLQNKGLYPVGKPLNRVALQPIEELIRRHPMVRTAECYKTVDGNVSISLTQRQPVVRVVTAAETYFVDTDHKLMPVRESVTTPVLVATGAVSHRMAQEELTDFALWLRQDKYWRRYIDRVEVQNPKMVHLKQIDQRATILLGDWQGYEKKLSKLRHWYEADTLIHQNQYQQVDLRFHNQVIGITDSPINRLTK